MTSRTLSRFGVLMAIALALLLAVSGPAAGEPDCEDPKFADNPHCQDPGPLPDHPGGGTCEASGDAWIAATDGFTHTFNDKLLCVDWTTTEQTSWTIELSGARSFYASVRDSHPGDFCWNISDGLEIPNLPIAAIDACGTEYTDLADPLEKAIPYALTVAYKGKTSSVTVTVCPDPLGDNPPEYCEEP